AEVVMDRLFRGAPTGAGGKLRGLHTRGAFAGAARADRGRPRGDALLAGVVVTGLRGRRRRGIGAGRGLFLSGVAQRPHGAVAARSGTRTVRPRHGRGAAVDTGERPIDRGGRL
ncbi:MAG: hypothetical protein AVDCRST_MAG03-2750, partial [uncultured Rubrobacteraceae bacterium]